MLRRNVRHMAVSARRMEQLYSSTLLLPKTLFSPKIPRGADRARLLEKNGHTLYTWQQLRPDSAQGFTLHDGPPYANGDLHLGHALNKILKDIINRHQVMYHNLKVHYVPGWDCHGLPIEMKAVKDAGQLDAVEVRRRCRELAAAMIDKQRQQFREFGIMADFDRAYQTMLPQYEAAQLAIFVKLFENGLLLRQLKPVWWGCETQTALAEAELEYNPQHRSTAVYVKYPLAAEFMGMAAGRVSLLIWTSTPWTLPANKAICVHRDIDYTLLRHTSGTAVVVAAALADSVVALDGAYAATGTTFKGAVLEGRWYTNPSFGTTDQYPVLHGDHVSATAGSGLVHTAPAHGAEDYVVGKRHGLAIESVVDAHGKYEARAMPRGMRQWGGAYANGSGAIRRGLDHLRAHGMLVHVEQYTHLYPYDWRSKTPVIQRATPQWFVNVDRIKAAAAALLAAVEFVPEAGRNRLALFVHNRSEWCISRQRAWGVPLPMVYCRTTHEPRADMATVRCVAARMAQYGTDAWFEPEDDVSRWLPAGVDGTRYYKGRDTMDVWFDSGTLWSVLAEGSPERLRALMAADTPAADVYLEGSDQHRGWFQSSLLNKIIASGNDGAFKAVAPFAKIITHGFTLDSKNAKMSKLVGNVVAPRHVIDGGGKPAVPALGVDGLRLWAALSNYTQDVNVTPEVLARVHENIKKLRVTFKYMLGNLADFDHARDAVAPGAMAPLDRWMLARLARLQLSVADAYRTHNFARVVREINAHMSTDLSATYFDACKDTLYTAARDSPRRRAVQTALAVLVRAYVGMLAPIQPVLAQEVWEHAGAGVGAGAGAGAETPFHCRWDVFAVPAEVAAAPAVERDFDVVWAVRNALHKQFEALRARGLFKNRMEAEVVVEAAGDAAAVFARHAPYLDDYFGVSLVVVAGAGALDGREYASAEVFSVAGAEVRAAVVRLRRGKCPRCWKHVAAAEGALCAKCAAVVHPA